MRCPYCQADDTRVIDSRPAEHGTIIRRRRRCSSCENRFTTYERAEAPMSVRKRDGHLEPFDAAKIRHGLERALADRPVAPATLDRIVARIEAQLTEVGPQLDTDMIGRVVLDHLRDLDEPAYLRFASVYKDFEDAEDFEREMAELGDTQRD
jgi:transcriptional repressor NrdR